MEESEIFGIVQVTLNEPGSEAANTCKLFKGDNYLKISASKDGFVQTNEDNQDGLFNILLNEKDDYNIEDLGRGIGVCKVYKDPKTRLKTHKIFELPEGKAFFVDNLKFAFFPADSDIFTQWKTEEDKRAFLLRKKQQNPPKPNILDEDHNRLREEEEKWIREMEQKSKHDQKKEKEDQNKLYLNKEEICNDDDVTEKAETQEKYKEKNNSQKIFEEAEEPRNVNVVIKKSIEKNSGFPLIRVNNDEADVADDGLKMKKIQERYAGLPLKPIIVDEGEIVKQNFDKKKSGFPLNNNVESTKKNEGKPFVYDLESAENEEPVKNNQERHSLANADDGRNKKKSIEQNPAFPLIPFKTNATENDRIKKMNEEKSPAFPLKNVNVCMPEIKEPLKKSKEKMLVASTEISKSNPAQNEATLVPTKDRNLGLNLNPDLNTKGTIPQKKQELELEVSIEIPHKNANKNDGNMGKNKDKAIDSSIEIFQVKAPEATKKSQEKKIIVANPPNPVDLIKTNLSKDESKAKKSEEKIVSLDVSKASQAKDDGKNELKIVDIPNKKDDGKISKKEEKNVIVEVSKAKDDGKIKKSVENKIEANPSKDDGKMKNGLEIKGEANIEKKAIAVVKPQENIPNNEGTVKKTIEEKNAQSDVVKNDSTVKKFQEEKIFVENKAKTNIVDNLLDNLDDGEVKKPPLQAFDEEQRKKWEEEENKKKKGADDKKRKREEKAKKEEEEKLKKKIKLEEQEDKLLKQRMATEIKNVSDTKKLVNLDFLKGKKSKGFNEEEQSKGKTSKNSNEEKKGEESANFSFLKDKYPQPGESGQSNQQQDQPQQPPQQSKSYENIFKSDGFKKVDFQKDQFLSKFLLDDPAPKKAKPAPKKAKAEKTDEDSTTKAKPKNSKKTTQDNDKNENKLIEKLQSGTGKNNLVDNKADTEKKAPEPKKRKKSTKKNENSSSERGESKHEQSQLKLDEFIFIRPESKKSEKSVDNKTENSNSKSKQIETPNKNNSKLQSKATELNKKISSNNSKQDLKISPKKTENFSKNSKNKISFDSDDEVRSNKNYSPIRNNIFLDEEEDEENLELRNNISSQNTNKKQTETKIQSQASKKKEKDPLEKNERIAVSVAETKKPPVKRKRIENYSDDDYSPNQEEIEAKPKKKPALKNPPKKTQATKKESDKASKKIEKFQKKITTFQATLTENNEVAELILQKRIMHRVICSGFLFTEKEKKKLTAIGIRVNQEKSMNFDLLLMRQCRRTIKFLLALTKGIPIVSATWLDDSMKQNSLLNYENYLLSDKKSEKFYGYNLRSSLQKRKNGDPFLDGCRIWVPTTIEPGFKDVKLLIRESGGEVLHEMYRGNEKLTFNLMNETDSQVKYLKKQGYIIHSVELLFTGILRQHLDPRSFLL